MSPAILLATLAVTGGGWDLATRRIPNWLTFSIAVAGLAWNTYAGGVRGLGMSAAGLALGVAILLPFFLLGGTGAGDVKMLGAAGAVVGPVSLLPIFIYFALIGGVAAIGVAMASGKLGAVVANTATLAANLGAGRWNASKHLESAAPRLPYGAVIAAGCLLFLWIGPKTL